MENMFRPVWTEVGLCYTFNGHSPGLVTTDTGDIDLPPLRVLGHGAISSTELSSRRIL